MHPIRPVYVGRNGFCVSTVPPVRASNGEIMVPFYLPPLDEALRYYNPVNAFTFSDGGVLIGQWTPDGSDITWRLGQTVRMEADQSTRGVDEPAIVELQTPGHWLMIIRASNDSSPKPMDGYKFRCVSRDNCRTWSKPEPFTYADGTRFFSPAACSAILRARNGKLIWIGNICKENPKGNSPRYPLVWGEVDEAALGVKRETVQVLDDYDPAKDTPQVQFSNFNVTEDAKTGDLIVTLTRLDAGKGDWTKMKFPTCRYMIPVR